MAARVLPLPLLLVGLLAVCAGVLSTVEVKGVCRLPLQRGPCMALFIRWYYHWEARRCKQFYYGGCRGNANNFKSLAECERRCGGQRPRRNSGGCPIPKGAGACVERCRSNADCGPGRLCCGNGCGHVCREPVAGPR